MTDLVVDLYGERAGVLVEGRSGFDFVAEPAALQRWGVGSTALSFAVPLTSRPRPRDIEMRRNFFDEILPEGRARRRLAGNARIRQDYTIGMLARYGRDVAGAVKIWDPAAPGEPREPAYALIDDTKAGRMLDEVATNPLGNTGIRRMSSLAGVQDKIVLARIDGSWAEPLDGYASTHIIKPIMPDYGTLIFDEEYGARIARHLGLAAIARVLRRIDRDAPVQLLRLTTMSLAVGNLDMHAKNISVLHEPDGNVRLAPAYDIVPQLHHDIDPDVALWVNGKARHAEITLDDLVSEAAEWGIHDARAIVTDTVQRIEDFVRSERRISSRLLSGEAGSEGGDPDQSNTSDRDASRRHLRSPDSAGGSDIGSLGGVSPLLPTFCEAGSF